MEISYRIKKLIECVGKCDGLADIGCDHGLIPYFLLKNKTCQRAVLVDVSEKSLNKAKKLFLKAGLIEKADFRIGDGLSVLKDCEVDFAVIAGLGGMEIINILAAGDKNIKNFILQPMKNAYQLRDFLVKNNFKLKKDFIIFDNGHFYDIIICERCLSNNLHENSLTEAELVFGKDNIKNITEDFIKFLDYRKIQTEKILNKVKNKRREELINYLKIIEDIMNN